MQLFTKLKLNKNLKLTRFVDATFASDAIQRSISGHILHLGSTLVAARCKAQKTVKPLASGAELAEIVSNSNLAVSIGQLLKKVFKVLVQTPVVLTDSQTSVNTMFRPVSNAS